MDAFSLEDQSFIHDRTAELAAQHRKYLEQHPELTQLLHDFVTNCLVNKVRFSTNMATSWYTEPHGLWQCSQMIASNFAMNFLLDLLEEMGSATLSMGGDTLHVEPW